MNYKNLVSAIFFILINQQVYSQVKFQKTYQYFSDYWGLNSVSELPGGGYILSGGSIATSNNHDARLIRINSIGDTLWTRSYGDSTGTQTSTRFNSLALTSTGGFFTAGSSEGFGNSWDYFLVHTNSLGDTLWTRSINDPGNSVDYCYSALIAHDGNFVTFGSRGGFEGDFFLSKNNSSGGIIWTKGYSRTGNTDLGFSVAQTPDSGFIMTGSTEATVDTDVLVVKVDSLGNYQWSKIYAGNALDEAKKICATQNGGYVIGCTTESLGNGFKDILLIRINSFGDTLWTRTYGTSLTDELASVKQTPDQGFIIVGTSYNAAVNHNNLVLIKTDASGNITWSKYYGTIDPGIAGKDVICTSDNGYLACGNFSGKGYVIKTDSNGNSGCNESTATFTTSSTSLVITNPTINTANGSILRFPPTSLGRGGQVNNYCVFTELTDDELNQNKVLAYPNPASGNIFFNIPIDNASGTIEIIDLNGKVVQFNNYFSRDVNLITSLSGNQFYFYRIIDDSGKIFNGKIILM